MRMNRCRTRPFALRSAASCAIVALSFAGCGIGEAREATAYWRRLEVKSVSLTREFLKAVATGDSAAISAVATDSVVGMVMKMKRHSAAGALTAAARQFPGRDTEVRVFGSGADVSFRYEYEGRTMRAGVETGYLTKRLVVTNFGSHVWID